MCLYMYGEFAWFGKPPSSVPPLHKVVKALEETEVQNSRLHGYIEGLLVTIMEHHPEMLEKT